MRKAFLLSLAALPLLAFDCGGPDPEPAFNPFGCTLSVRGAVSEDLWCIATVYDYSAFPDAELRSELFVIELVAYRGSLAEMEVAGGVGVWLSDRAVVSVPYGWNASAGTSNVLGGDAVRYATVNGFPETTHSADAPLSEFDAGTGALSVTLTRIPAASATNEELLGVDGSLTATLPSWTDGAPVTFSARF